MSKILATKILCDGIHIIKSLNETNNPKFQLLINGVDTKALKRKSINGKKIRKELNISSGAYVIGNIARITAWKGQEYLLKAFIRYSKTNPNAILLLVGSPLFSNDNYYKNILQIIQKNQISKKVILTGYRDDISDILSAMDLFLYSSIEKDTLPLSLLSAISSGIPVGISDIDSLVDIFDIAPEIDRFIFSSENDIIYIMKKYEDEEKRLLVGQKNYEIGRNNFDIRVHSESFLEIINKYVFK